MLGPGGRDQRIACIRGGRGVAFDQRLWYGPGEGRGQRRKEVASGLLQPELQRERIGHKQPSADQGSAALRRAGRTWAGVEGVRALDGVEVVRDGRLCGGIERTVD